MSRAIQDATALREALSRFPELDLGELRQQWRGGFGPAARIWPPVVDTFASLLRLWALGGAGGAKSP